MSTTTFKEQLEKLINRAETELDELKVKIALGKMNGADLFEEMKKELHGGIQKITHDLKSNSNDLVKDVITHLESLQVQLALGKAEALDAYEEQKEKINQAISQLEVDIRNKKNELSYECRIKIQNELEMFRLKMEVLQIRYELGKLDMKDNLETRKEAFKKEFDRLLENIREDTKDKIAEYGQNLKEAYDTLRKSL
jgi:uncharacterized protein YjbJ (UPF0337 family)